MDAPSPTLGVAAEPPPPQVRPEAAPLTVGTTIPVVTAPPAAWPRAAQWATAALLLLALGLLGWHASYALRWGGRPTDLTRDDPAAGRIDLNHADHAQLLQLPGVGETLAQRIEEYRRSHNGFQSVDELRQVRGIGTAILDRLRPLVEVQPYDVSDSGADPAPPADPPNADPPAKADRAAPRTATGSRKKDEAPAQPIDVNRATADELQQLPGVGPTLSARIIQARQQRPFRLVDDLRHVKGIGPKTLESLRPYVKVD
jgi:competence ComEA-like helix-hairpin-helix protein